MKVVRNIMLVFVLVTIGFVLGTESAKRQFASTAPVSSSVVAVDNSTDVNVQNVDVVRKVLVYYTHANARCKTCNAIEALAHETIKKRFNDELAKGVVEWNVVNFQQDEDFAKRYKILSSTLVVVVMEGDREIGYKLLDGVWTNVHDPVVFEEYVATAVRESLSGKEEVSE